jgi:hypothetical protein
VFCLEEACFLVFSKTDDHNILSGGKLGTLFDIYIVIHGYIRLVDQNTSVFTYLCNAKVYEFCICKVSATLQV